MTTSSAASSQTAMDLPCDSQTPMMAARNPAPVTQPKPARTARSTPLPNPALMVNEIDNFFGAPASPVKKPKPAVPKRSSRGEDELYPDAKASSQGTLAPPPYEVPAHLAPTPKPTTVARYLFLYGFLFPPFWVIGACILLSPLTSEPQPSPAKDLEASPGYQKAELGVARKTELEKAGLFRKYVMINSVAVIAAFCVAAAFIAISGTRHSAASDRCQKSFFAGNNTPGSSDDSGEGEQICEVFTWVILGLMGGLWVSLLSFQSYLLLVTRFYSQSQRADHKKYYTIYSTLDIPLSDRQHADDAWNVRPSTDSWHAGAAMGANDAQYHRRQNSAATYADDEKYDSEPSYGVRRYESDRTLAEPHRAVTEEPGPTPVAGGFVGHAQGGGYYDAQDLQRPEQPRYHPAEGSFGRKTPRMHG
ncbi:hypothetical protein FRC06_003281 [Ceratobasidium sp. 370]|nr:hypothetical protein FRC06_003281 [Ceratobasidium sp. 370]